MVSSSCLFYDFSEILLPERSLVEGEKLQQKQTRKEKGKAKKLIDKNRKPKVVWRLSQILICAHAPAKKLLNMIFVKSKNAFLIPRALGVIWFYSSL